MNSAVDLNETRILILLIVLAAEICYEAKDMHRAFYFYNQAVFRLVIKENRINLCKSA